MEKNNDKKINRAPVVVVMGHVDHGKSTLLDYIRSTNIVDKEAGGITQHISAYEVVHQDEHKVDRKITFLDTPGHEAFSKMRERGADCADIAILVVSAEDSVKAQTLEAWNTIIENKIPYIVAINKIDKPNANIEKTKMDLLEKGIYLEGLGGDIPFVPISAKVGTGVDDLLSLILLVTDLNTLSGSVDINAEGVIIESHRDPKRGISATAIIKNGKLESGMFIVVGDAITTTRIMENFLGKPVKILTCSSPVHLVGFDKVPEVGSTFYSFKNKKDAEAHIQYEKENGPNTKKDEYKNDKNIKTIPIIIKTDVSGTIEAIEKQIEKLNTTEITFRVIVKGVGNISEADLKSASIDKDSLIVGFNVKLEPNARDLNENLHVDIKMFNIIYELTDALATLAEERRPRQEIMETSGKLKVLKTFGETKNSKVVGGKVIEGKITDGNVVRIMRRDFEIGRGKITGLQLNKIKTKMVEEGTECGVMIDTKIDIATGDIIESFNIVIQ
jgi:translation initiation factor IF-2